MKKLKLILVTLIACPFLTGCAILFLLFSPSPSNSVEESWTKKPNKVNIVFTDPFLDDPEKFDQDIPEYPGRFNDWFIAELISDLENRTSGIHYSMKRIPKDKIKIEKVLHKDEGVNAPVFTEMDKSAEIYLVLDSLWIGKTKKGTTCESNIDIMNGCKLLYLTAKGNFAYYDTKDGKRVGFGKIESNSKYWSAITRGNWTGMVNLTSKKVLLGTPLED